MKISELILAIGDDNVQFQNLDRSADALNMSGGVTNITFGTEQPITLQGTEKLGIVIWLDRQAVADALASSKAKAKDAGL